MASPPDQGWWKRGSLNIYNSSGTSSTNLEIGDIDLKSNTIIINTDIVRGRVNKNIYGHFAEHLGRCIYEGVWVGEDSPISNTAGIRNDVVEALKKIDIPVLRWPGGCFADEYHWKDGIGPRETRPEMVNTHWGKVVENNHFGTHEFFDLCSMLDAEPYICGNVGSGTVYEMQEWVEYITFDGKSPMSDLRAENGREEPWKLKYFGVGNENWGCGGNMRAEHYADLYKQYQTYVREFGENNIYRIACGPDQNAYRWTEVLMREAARFMDGLSLHYYTRPGGKIHSATGFTEDEWFEILGKTLYMDELIEKHSKIMDQYDPDKRIGLIVDEWGTWYRVEPGTNPGFLYQQNSLRDALVAGINLNIFNKHCDRVQMANIAQTINVLQAMVLTKGDEMIVTPSYHVFEMFKVHQDAELLDLELHCDDYEHNGESIPQISASATRDSEGRVNISLCNLHASRPADIRCELRGAIDGKVSGRVLTAPEIDSHNTFEEPNNVTPEIFKDVKLKDGTLSARLPAASVTVLSVE